MTFENKFPELKGLNETFDIDKYYKESTISNFCFSKSWIIKQIKEIQKNFEKENWKKQYTTKGGLKPLIPYLHVQRKLDELLARLEK